MVPATLPASSGLVFSLAILLNNSMQRETSSMEDSFLGSDECRGERIDSAGERGREPCGSYSVSMTINAMMVVVRGMKHTMTEAY